MDVEVVFLTYFLSRPKTRRRVGPSLISECSLSNGKQICHWSTGLQHVQSSVVGTVGKRVSQNSKG